MSPSSAEETWGSIGMQSQVRYTCRALHMQRQYGRAVQSSIAVVRQRYMAVSGGGRTLLSSQSARAVAVEQAKRVLGRSSRWRYVSQQSRSGNLCAGVRCVALLVN